MKNVKKKFIGVIILFIVLILGTEIYKSFIVSGEDRNSYIVLFEGKANLNNNKLYLNKKVKLKTNDKIETIGEKSLAILKWGDGSITRLGGNSILVVKENQVEQNLLNIKISFKLEKGKSWSDVISFIGKDSYFNQSFADTTASVRGTVFEVNLEKDYFYVESNEVELIKESGKKVIIPEKKPFIISKFSFTELIKFLQNFKDTAWQKLNKDLDEKYYIELKQKFDKISKEVLNQNEKLQKKIDTFGNLSLKEKEELQKKLLENYQKLNFISVDDIENYKNKLNLKQDLIKISDGKDKENLVITSLYDIKSLIKNNNFKELSDVLKIISTNSDILYKSNIQIENYINTDVFKNINIPEGLGDVFKDNFENLKNNFNLENLELNNNILNNIKKSAEQSLNGVKENLENIKNLIK